MQNIASDLFLLTTSLSQLKSRDQIVRLFFESIHEIFPTYSFHWYSKGESVTEPSLPISTRSKTYGYIKFEETLRSNEELYALFQNATQLVAILLERLEQEELLGNQKIHLQYLVDEKTNHLVEKQDELNEMNEEFATLNEELIETNKSLLEVNLNLQNEIIERKKVEKKLHDSDKFFIYANDMLCIAGFDGYFKMLNPAWSKILGWSTEELLSKPWNEFVYPDDIESTNNVKSTIVDGEELYLFENRYICKDGSIKWLAWSSFPNPQEGIMFGVARDVTKLKQAEEELHKSEQNARDTSDLLEGLFNAIPDIIGLQDASHNILRYNDAGYRFLNTNQEQIKGKRCYELIGHTQQCTNCATSKAIETKKPAQIEKFIPEMGIWFEARSYPIFNKEGAITNIVEHLRDITDRKKSEEELLQNKNNFQVTIDESPLGIRIISKMGSTIYVNQTLLDIFGFSSIKGLNETPASKKYTAESYNEHLDRKEKRKRGEETLSEYEICIIRKSGEVRHLHVNRKNVLWDGEMQSMVIYQDITERKLAEVKLRESERLLNESQRISEIGSYELDMKLGIWAGSEYLNEMFGIDASDDHSIEGWLSVIHPDDKAMISIHFNNDVLGKKGRFDKEYRIVTKNTKQERWVHGVGELEFDTNGNPIKLFGTIRDITDRKKADDELRKLLRAVEQSPDSIIITDIMGRIEYANPAIQKLSGYTNDELIGNSHLIFNSGQMTLDQYSELWTAISSGNVWQGEFQDKRKNGELYWESATISPVIDTSGKISHYLIISEDITEKMILTQELIEAKEHAEESDRLKSSFLANMSHEIRTPMNSIMGFASLLPEEESRELMCQYANIIVQNSEQLVSLIDGIVMYSKLQTGLFMFRPTSFLVQNLFTEILQSFNLPAFQMGVILKIVCDIGETTKINSDYDKLRQVITNMIVNAFKYTPKGEITLGCEYKDGWFEFYVKDTGIGIPQKDLPHVFERFYRGSNINEAISRGTGLGLCIVKELVEMLGGNIWVESEVGKGSTFNFTIPVMSDLKTPVALAT